MLNKSQTFRNVSQQFIRFKFFWDLLGFGDFVWTQGCNWSTPVDISTINGLIDYKYIIIY